MSSWLGKGLLQFRDAFGLEGLDPGSMAKLFVAVQLEDGLARSVCEKIVGKQVADDMFSNQSAVARYARSAARRERARRSTPQELSRDSFLFEREQWMTLLGFFDMCLGPNRPADRDRQRQSALIAYTRDALVFAEFRMKMNSDRRLAPFVPLAVDLFLLMHQRSANLRHIVASLDISPWSDEPPGRRKPIDTQPLYDFLYSYEPSSQDIMRRDLERLFGLIAANGRSVADEMAAAARPPARGGAPPPPTSVVVYSSGEPEAHALAHVDAFRLAVIPRGIMPRPVIEWLYVAANLQQYRDLYAEVFEDDAHPAIDRCKAYRASVLLNEKLDGETCVQWNEFSDYKFSATPKALKRALQLAREFHAAVVEPNSGKQKTGGASDPTKLQRYLLVYTPVWQKKWAAKHGPLGDELEHAVVAYLSKAPMIPDDAIADLRAVYFE